MRRPAATAIIIFDKSSSIKIRSAASLQFQFPFSHGDTYIGRFQCRVVIDAIAHHGYNLLIFKALTTASFASGNILKGLYCELPLTFQLHSIS
jgi:hypothetical protein